MSYNKEYYKNYKRTKKGLIQVSYYGQRRTAKRRGHHFPDYDLYSLYWWCIQQSRFNYLYRKWVKSGYIPALRPTVDRIDSKKSYTMDNLQILTRRQNETKGGKYEADRTSMMKKVKQLTLSGKLIKIWDSRMEAARGLSVCATGICYAMKKPQYTYKGFKWESLY